MRNTCRPHPPFGFLSLPDQAQSGRQRGYHSPKYVPPPGSSKEPVLFCKAPGLWVSAVLHILGQSGHWGCLRDTAQEPLLYHQIPVSVGYEEQGLLFPHWLPDIGVARQLSVASKGCSPGCMGAKSVIHGSRISVHTYLACNCPGLKQKWALSD